MDLCAIPEDITLVSGGVIGRLYPENVNSHLMLLVSMIGVLAGDSCMYWFGRIYGTKIFLRFRPIRRIVTLQRLELCVKIPVNMAIEYCLLHDFYPVYVLQFIWYQVLYAV